MMSLSTVRFRTHMHDVSRYRTIVLRQAEDERLPVQPERIAAASGPEGQVECRSSRSCCVAALKRVAGCTTSSDMP
jgi:hypothetical protein